MSEHVYSNSPITGGPATPGPPTPLQAAVSTGHDFVSLAYLNSLGYLLNLGSTKAGKIIRCENWLQATHLVCVIKFLNEVMF
jgi:hypothetical protein